ncbi:MAG TPA: membrane protein insertase YidC [Candidatus Eisenbacteria bacterium]|jgi:YidC/Oxa1 family membrane protein insertase
MDRRTVAAIALCILFLLLYPQILRWAGLGRYAEPRRPVATAPADSGARAGSARPSPGGTEAVSPPASAPAGGELARAAAAPPAHAAPERVIEVETPLYRATFSSRGARLVDLTLKRFAPARGHAHGQPARPGRGGEYPESLRVSLAGGPTFGLDLGSGDNLHPLSAADYAVSESLDASGQIRALTFALAESSGLGVRQTYRVHPGDYSLDLAVELRGVPAASRLADYSLTVRSWPLLTEATPETDERMLRATSLVGDNIHREGARGLLKGPRSFDGNAAWAAVQTRYFLGAAAIVDAPARGVRSAATTRTLDPAEAARLGPKARADQEVAINSLVVGLPSAEHPVHRFLLYFGPSEYFGLQRHHLRLERAVDLGWSWILPFSSALLRLMNWLFGLVGNYGFAILALATLVRVVLHPLNMSSMKSMRRMQKVQPEVERLRAKYKNDPTAMNTAIMALYKENKVNPAGGCLPMLLQMPLLLGLYQVLFNAIELRQAPFVGWIHDLSAPDHLFDVAGFPIRLLPVLMALSGLLQQKMTPSDPRQQPTMYMMNVMMLVFFYGLPSGLVLYWTVMNLLTALQQWMLLHQDRESAASTAPAVETVGSGGGGRRRGAAR